MEKKRLTGKIFGIIICVILSLMTVVLIIISVYLSGQQRVVKDFLRAVENDTATSDYFKEGCALTAKDMNDRGVLSENITYTLKDREMNNPTTATIRAEIRSGDDDNRVSTNAVFSFEYIGGWKISDVSIG